MSTRVLVTGGAGYVGSHVVHACLEAGHTVSVVDDLSTGHRQAVPDAAALTVGDCGDAQVLDAAAGPGVDVVMHMAARCSPEQSMTDPAIYYDNIVGTGLRLLAWGRSRGVRHWVHSSTSSVFGEAARMPMDEDTELAPISSYGAAKLALDQALQWYASAYDLRVATFRYFNAAGAHPSGRVGEDKTPAYNLIPKTLGVALGREPHIRIFGDDYETRDGTAVRDYVHVVDIAAAHLAAFAALREERIEFEAFNLGSETGHTVLEVIESARRVTGHPIPAEREARRPGDPASLVASSRRARELLGWKPTRSELDTILEDAWRWHRTHPHGYQAEGGAG